MARALTRRRGYLEQLPSGSVRAVVFVGTDLLTGRPRYLRETHRTALEAEVALTKLLRQVDQQQHPKSAITVREAVEQWLEVAELGVTTREQYDDLMRLYIDPTLGKMQAGKLAELLERFYSRLLRCKHLCSLRPPKGHQCKPLGPSSVRKIHYMLRAAFDRAVRWRYLTVNPAELVSAPSPSATNPDPPTAQEAAAILNDAWRDPEWGLLMWLRMITGCRRLAAPGPADPRRGGRAPAPTPGRSSGASRPPDRGGPCADRGGDASAGGDRRALVLARGRPLRARREAHAGTVPRGCSSSTRSTPSAARMATFAPRRS